MDTDKSQKKNLIILGAAILILGGAFYFWTGGEKKEDKRDYNNEGIMKESVEVEKMEIRVMGVEGVEDSDFWLDYLEDGGFLERHNLEMEKIVFSSGLGKSTASMLISGEADIFVGGMSGILSAYLNGVDTVWLAKISHPFHYYGLSRFGKDEVGEIEKASMNRFGGEHHFVLLSALKDLGANVENVELVAVPGDPAREKLLEKNEIDFTLASSNDFMDEVNASEKYTIFDSFEMLGKSSIFRSLMSAKKPLEERPAEIKSFVVAFYEMLGFIEESPEEIKKYLSSKYGFTDQEAEDFYVRFSRAREGVEFVPSEDSITDLLGFIKEVDETDSSSRDIGSFVFPEYAKEAEARN